MKLRYLILALALNTGILYSSLLPLWNGFDEPFHYSYIETLLFWHHFPKFPETQITGEIRASLSLVPLSRLLSEIIPGSTAVEDWVYLPEGEKLRRKADLGKLPADLRHKVSDLPNYESQQAPLAFLLLLPFDAAMGSTPLAVRIFLLRLIGSIASTLLLYFAAQRLCRALELEPRFAAPALFCIFLTQMLWASVAHIGSDALAIPLTVLFLSSLVRVMRLQQPRELTILAVILAAGLVTKAYFMAFVPIFIALFATRHVRALLTWRLAAVSFALPLAIAGPWYLRNLLLYRSLSGTQESVSGVGLSQARAALPKINWLSSAILFARWSLWTGDWSFVSFSQITLNIEIVLMALSLSMYLWRYRKISSPERWLISACLLFGLGLVYQTCVTWVSTHGGSQSPESWYAQGMLVCIWVLTFKGLAGGGLIGRIVARLLCVVAAWIAIATYVGKLIPFYASASSRSTIHTVVTFWCNYRTEDLASIILGPVPLFYGTLAAFLLLIFVVGVLSVRGLKAELTRSCSFGRWPT